MNYQLHAGKKGNLMCSARIIKSGCRRMTGKKEEKIPLWKKKSPFALQKGIREPEILQSGIQAFYILNRPYLAQKVDDVCRIIDEFKRGRAVQSHTECREGPITMDPHQ